MIWWHWLLLGLLLLGAEMMTPGGFYILFFGLAALVVGAIAALDLVQEASAQWLLFSGIAIASLLVFRGPLLTRINASKTTPPDVDSMLGEIAIPIDTLAAGAIGKVELRGTTWSARNAGATSLQKGQRSKVTGMDGLTLQISGE
ncbi:MAG: Putative activity regulator of membrane protease YbbK [Nitrospira sp.]|nr:MAG: Putative activity regulator of membrane protease YbbK [Nitrospira sp.]